MAFRYTNEPEPTPVEKTSTTSTNSTKKASNLKKSGKSKASSSTRNVSFATPTDDDQHDNNNNNNNNTNSINSSTNELQLSYDDADTDAELELEAQRAFVKLSQGNVLFGLDFDQYRDIGASSSSARGRGVHVQRRQELMAGLQAEAEALLEQGDFERSFEKCVEMIRENPRGKEAYILLAEIMERKPEPDLPHALDYLSLAAQFHKRDVALWTHIADLACAVHAYETAILANRMMLKYGDERLDRAEVTHQLALCYENNRDDEKAHKQIIDVSKMPVPFSLVINVAIQLYKYGEVERAIEFVCRQLSALSSPNQAAPISASETIDFRNNFAAVLTQMYRENYLHQECVVFLGLLLGAPREQFQPVIDQLAAEAAESAAREARALRNKRAAGDAGDDDDEDDEEEEDDDDGEADTLPSQPIVITMRNLPAMLPLQTVIAAGLITSKESTASNNNNSSNSSRQNDNSDAKDDDDDDDEAALFGVRTTAKAISSKAAATPSTASTRLVNERGVVLLEGNVLLGDAAPSIDLVTPYACSLAECVGLEKAQPLFEYLLSIDREFDLHIRIARTLMEIGSVALAQHTLERIFEQMTTLPDGVDDFEVPGKLMGLLLHLYSMCCERRGELDKSYALHERALAHFPLVDAVVVRVAQEFESRGEYERARETLHTLYSSLLAESVAVMTANHEGVSADVINAEALEQLIATYPKLVAMYFMMELFVGGGEATFMAAGRSILSSRAYMHAPLSSQKFDKQTAQRAHLRARQGAEVGGEVQSLIVALGPELYADLCAQVGYFLLEHDDRERALLVAQNALSAQRIARTDRRSRRLSRVVKFNDDAIARLAWLAVRATNNGADRARFARMMVKHAPNSFYVWQLVLGETSLQSLMASLTADAERGAHSRPPTPASAVPLVARGLYLLKQGQFVGAIKSLEDALRRRPDAALPALLVTVASVRQASVASAHSDTLGQALSALWRYAALRVEPTVELTDDIREAEVAYNCGRALHALGWANQAETFYREAIDKLRGDPSELLVRIAAHNLALLYEQRGDWTRAAATTDQYMKFA
jgi:tetratricopeptide (TPR) repeat protein